MPDRVRDLLVDLELEGVHLLEILLVLGLLHASVLAIGQVLLRELLVLFLPLPILLLSLLDHRRVLLLLNSQRVNAVHDDLGLLV